MNNVFALKLSIFGYKCKVNKMLMFLLDFIILKFVQFYLVTIYSFILLFLQNKKLKIYANFIRILSTLYFWPLGRKFDTIRSLIK